MSEKILTKETLKKKLATQRKRKTIAFTNGCFDILHLGHISYLQKAKGKNRILVLGLNSDSSVRKLKGRSRPIVPQKERAKILAALECVDYITIFNEDTPEKLIGYLKPDVMIKGADWKGKKVAGADIVKSYGGKVEFIKFLPRHSTTNIIKKIARTCRK